MDINQANAPKYDHKSLYDVFTKMRNDHRQKNWYKQVDTEKPQKR